MALRPGHLREQRPAGRVYPNPALLDDRAFAGIALFGDRAFILGFDVLAGSPAAPIALIPHLLTILIEFQAYVLLMLGAYLLGRAWLRPGLVGEANRRQGYLHGLRQIGWLRLPGLARSSSARSTRAFSSS